MNLRVFLQATACAALALVFAGCATKPYDYTNYRQHPPRSILVLPPLNESTTVQGTYSYLATVTSPVAEMGYYVYPVAVVDQFLKENGMPTPGEMHQVPLNKVAEIVGADAVMFVTLKEYGTKYQILNSATTVRVKARLVDTKTGLLLWEGEGMAQQNSSSGNIFADLISAAITQAINSSRDAAYPVCRIANDNLFVPKGHGLLYGPYHPQYAVDK
ncbi:MAG TPA: GNA1162 family protein [Candidatus Sulfotelmatobacter sp.]|nr:GNA1162 family protein [Candidatus Sulfotelmatobacter sp.]